jgi:hypothetical protein
MSYINLDSQYGKLTRVYHIGSKLFLHTSDGVYQSNIGSTKIPSTIGELLMGSDDMISRPQLITNTSAEGDYGLEHPNHGKLTALGYIFVDYNSKSLIIFTGSSFDILSAPDKKMNKFFKEYLSFCTSNGCSFEQMEGTNYYSIGVDYKHNRLLFTKADGKYSYTMSYDYNKKIWVSFHKYIPQEYSFDRNDMYTIYKNSIYKHDNTKEYNTHDGKYYGCRIDFNSTINYKDDTPDDNTFMYESTALNTEARVGNKRSTDYTFNKVNVSNSYQSTGDINLQFIDKQGIKDNNNTIDLIKVNNSSFRFHELSNYISDDSLDILKTDRCLPEPILNKNVDYSNKSKQIYNNKLLIDNHLYYSFIFDNFAKVKLYIKNIVTRFNKKTS